MITLEQLEDAPIGTEVGPDVDDEYFVRVPRDALHGVDWRCGADTRPWFTHVGLLEYLTFDTTITYPTVPRPVPDILSEARETISGDRQDDYGDASESFTRIAGLWAAYMGAEVSAKDVAHMMILLKVSRAKTTDKRDSYVDMAGYAACVAEHLNNPYRKDEER